MKKIVGSSLFWVFLTIYGTAYAAVNNDSLTKVSDKLDELIKGQKQVLQELAEIKQELYVVKIRASRH